MINDSPIKQVAENRHAVGQSMFESFMRITNRSTTGSRATVFGYGPCGKGVANYFRNAFSVVSVVEPGPVMLLEAHLDGFLTPQRDIAVSSADIIVTQAGAAGVISTDDLSCLKDGVILMIGGHFPTEFDVVGLCSDSRVAGSASYEEGSLTSLAPIDGRNVHIATRGHMANLAGPRPMGNSVESMDLGFALQAKCLERVASGKLTADECVVPVPREIDEWVAETHLEMVRKAGALSY